jgi:hypothetical protein
LSGSQTLSCDARLDLIFSYTKKPVNQPISTGTSFPDSPTRRYSPVFGRLSGRKRGGRLKYVGENLTGAADLHLLFPVVVNAALTNGAIDKPTEISAFKLPSRTFFLLFGWAFFYPPALSVGFRAVGYT